MMGPKPRDLTGQRFGKLAVLGRFGRRRFPCGQTPVAWDVLCDCGFRFTLTGNNLRNRGQESCLRCSRMESAEAKSIVLSTGETIRSLSLRSGVKVNTIFVRMRRGWPHERLGEPLRPGGSRSFTTNLSKQRSSP